ncbi:MAG: hypothetical protein ACI9XO_004707 [Paraglaciecola sp.]|jgi:hypothetical protein
MKYLILTFFLFFSIFFSCQKEIKNNNPICQKELPKIFKSLSSKESGITFSNDLKEDSIINYFTYPYIYMGGGVAVGDVNNDGFSDIYFTGNMVKNGLFLNKGDLKFEDITEQANVGSDDRWFTGVTMADVNADGWLDIYVSVSGKFTTTKNQLFINQGTSENGVPTFIEEAGKRGIADAGRSTQSTFFDYDKDGDLDLYVANYPSTHFKTPNYSFKIAINKKSSEKSDRLYRNDGHGIFENVTKEAGLLNFGLSLSATVADFNEDGWEDIYVSNDFASPDFFYFNNGDGTFSEKSKETTQHTAFFGMGSDVGDFNNDGLPDLLQVDMTPADNRRNKANMASMNIAGFWEVVNRGMHYQYMQNALQLNNGIGEDGLPHFSEISRMTGMPSTDWSWAGLFADLDNDGWQDIFISNGTRRDINNKDYFNEIEKATYQEKQKQTKLGLTLNMPSEKVDNYVYKNNGDLSFQLANEDWGISYKGFSNGAAYADLDNDGDLEMIVNNIDDKVSIFENKTADLGLGNHIRIKLNGNDKNPLGLGTKILIKTKNGIQYRQQTLTRGFQSSVDPVIHFGLGEMTLIEELTIHWTDGKEQTLINTKANQTLEIDYRNAKQTTEPFRVNTSQSQWFEDVTEESKIDFKHEENNFNDYRHEILLPHTYSKNGPSLAVGDVNGDGLDDFYVGGALDAVGAIYLQNAKGKFEKGSLYPWDKDRNKEDIGATFFDADRDGDLDLYIVSGGNESKKGSVKLQDRLYLNGGKGNFEKAENALPKIGASGSIVKAADYDNDGDLDLFVGGRIVPQSYPLPAQSYILRNDGIENGAPKFTDVTENLAPYLTEAGLVTDAVWVDFNNDQKLDLVVTGEWMPITFLMNTGTEFENKTEDFGLEKTTGWWYSIAAEDFDNDGDKDLVVGNLGLNYKYQTSANESFDVYASDYDKNGKLDIVLGYYDEGVQYPVRGRQCSAEQIPAIKYKYEDYNSFADASLEDIYTQQDLAAGLHYQAWSFASVYVENKGNDAFEIHYLPNEVQLSSINGIVAEDFNNDGHLDLAIAGNLFGSEVETTRNDASYGTILSGNGKGEFTPLPYSKSGFFLGGDVKTLEKIKTPKGSALLIGNNDAALQLIQCVFDPQEL